MLRSGSFGAGGVLDAACCAAAAAHRAGSTPGGGGIKSIPGGRCGTTGNGGAGGGGGAAAGAAFFDAFGAFLLALGIVPPPSLCIWLPGVEQRQAAVRKLADGMTADALSAMGSFARSTGAAL